MPITTAVSLEMSTSLLLGRPPAGDHAGVEVVAHRAGGRERQARHDGQDGGEGHGGDEAVEQRAADRLRQGQRRHVAAADQSGQLVVGAVRLERVVGRVRHQVDDGAEADDEGEDVEVADEARGVEHRLARRLGVRDGEEPHQDMGQAGRAEHQGEAERHRRHRVGDEAAGAQDGGALGLDLHGVGHQGVEVEAVVDQHRQRHRGSAEQQQAGLDDLHRGGGLHAAEGHVDDHQHADDRHRVAVGKAEQQLDERAGADHLGDEVEGHDRERADRRQDADGGLVEPEGGDVGEGELAEVAQPLRDEEQHDRPADEEADRVDQPVEARREDQRRDAQEGRRRHVVARDGQRVLARRYRAAGGVEVRGRFGLPCRPVGDAERQQHEEQEDDDGGPVGGALRRLAEVRAGRGSGGGREGHGRRGGREGAGRGQAHHIASRFSWAVRSSKRPLARDT